MKSIPYGKQSITDEDIYAVVKTLKSDLLTQGPAIDEFEKNFADYVGAKYAVTVSNGTAALHLSAIAMGVKIGTKVITTPLTFVATANCIEYCGGQVVFGDIDPNTYTLDINSVRKILNESPKGTYSGIIPVDFAGRAVNMEEFSELAKEYDLWIIEDACHAPGGYFTDSNNKNVECGSCKYADIAIFSFHPVKHIAAGEGGMITTNDYDVYQSLLMLRTHGIVRDPSLFKNTKNIANGNSYEKTFPKWYMEMQALGYNYRLTDIQAALGNSQLKRADKNLEIRKSIASRYYKKFKNISSIKSQSGVVKGHAYHLYVIEVENRNELYKFLKEKNIFCQIHYFPVHLMPYYKEKYNYDNLIFSEQYYKDCLSLPIYPTLSLKEQEYVVNQIIEFFK